MQRNDVDHVDARVNKLGASLFFDPVTVDAAGKHGVTDLVALIFGGRVGAMGDVDVLQLIDTFPFVSPTMLEATWPAVEAVGGPVAMRRIFSEAVSAAASARWNATAMQTVGTTARALIAPVASVALGLSAGWRSIALDEALPGPERVIASLFALRELRGDIHIENVREIGLTPFEAEIATSGPLVAELHGWPPPFPDAAPFEQRSDAAGDRTSARMVEIYDAALDDVTFESFDKALRTLRVDRR